MTDFLCKSTNLHGYIMRYIYSRVAELVATALVTNLFRKK